MARCIVRETPNHTLEFSEDQQEWGHKWDSNKVFYSLEYDNECPLISTRKKRKAINLAMST